MKKYRAQILIVAMASVVVVVAVLGLAVLGANSSAIGLGVIIPTLIAAHLCSRAVMHDGRLRAGRGSRRH